MKRLVATALLLATLFAAPLAARATIPPEQPPASDPSATTTPDTSTTLADVVQTDSGAAVALPNAAPSAPLLQIPTGCETPPIASVVFVGTLVAKDFQTARYNVERIRAGSADGFIVSGLVDIRYDDETQFLTTNGRYLVGAVPLATNVALSSKVRESKLLFGGNAVIGLTEKHRECPAIEDPVRTLNVDGTPLDASIFTGLRTAKSKIVLAFLGPLAIAIGIVLAIVLIRWLFAAILVSVRRAAEGAPVASARRDRRHDLF